MATDSPLKRLLVHTTHYGVTSLFNMVAGLVTFPLLTRLFSVADYGTMNLVAATLTISVAVGKVGLQHSILRYHSEIQAGKSRYTLAQLAATTFLGMGGTALAVMLALVIFAQLAPPHWLGDPRLGRLFAIAGLLIVVQVLESALVNFLRAEQLTSVLMKYQIAKKYLGLGFILIAVLLISRTLTAFYSASVVSETVAVGLLGLWMFRRSERARPHAAEFSRPLYVEMLGFGIPMMIGYELSGLILSVGDRYVIDGIMGEEQLGLYAAAYNLCQYVQALVIASIGQAIMPIYMQMWDQKGVAETSAFIGRSLRTYLMFGIPIVAGLAAVGPELLPSLASEKYASAAGILPWVMGGMVADGTNSMLGAGLFIHRKTRTIMTIVLSCAALNIVLNLILVPRIGIQGAAIATLICYSIAAPSMAWAGRSLLPIALPWRTLLTAGVASVAMYFALIHVMPGRRLLSVGVRALLGIPIYGGIMMLISPDARALMGKLINRFRRKAAP
ncbi:MAG: polysaccharide biosynthesis protein [Myxococcales bacterium]|nr:polysaccharide biosynthesis protein [Myxococcales bacterium]